MILFVCSQGRIRSRTAEVLSLIGGIEARCAGTDESALACLSNSLLYEAGHVFCMEPRHKRIIEGMVAAERLVTEDKISVLGIEDVYSPFEASLVDILTSSISRCNNDVSSAVAQAIENGYGRYIGLEDLAPRGWPIPD